VLDTPAFQIVGLCKRQCYRISSCITRGARCWQRRIPRNVLGGILWVLRTGVPWHDLPERYPPTRPATPACSGGGAQRHAGAGARGLRRRSQQTWRPGSLGVLYRRHLRGGKTGEGHRKTKRGKGTRLTASADGSDLRVSLCAAECVTPREVSLLGETLEAAL
jgi:transposase